MVECSPDEHSAPVRFLFVVPPSGGSSKIGQGKGVRNQKPSFHHITVPDTFGPFGLPTRPRHRPSLAPSPKKRSPTPLPEPIGSPNQRANNSIPTMPSQSPVPSAPPATQMTSPDCTLHSPMRRALKSKSTSLSPTSRLPVTAPRSRRWICCGFGSMGRGNQLEFPLREARCVSTLESSR